MMMMAMTMAMAILIFPGYGITYDENADGNNIGSGGASATGINRMLTNHGHVQPVLCSNSAL